MHRYFGGQKSPWPPALGLSLALHLGALAVLGHSKWPRITAGVRPEPLVVYLSDRLPAPPLEAMLPEPAPAPAEAAEAAPAAPAANSDDGALQTAEAESEEAADPPTPIQRAVDWQEEARRAVVRLREQQAQADAYVTFGNPFSEEAPTGLSSEAGQRRAERHLPPERSSYGEMITSLGGGCYLIAGGSILVAQAFSFSDYKSLGRTECPIPMGPRNDLFSEQKPDYFK